VTDAQIDVAYLPVHVRHWAEKYVDLLDLVAADLVASSSTWSWKVLIL